LPLEVRVAAGNENEQRHLIPLVDALIGRGICPIEVWADRGYDSTRVREELTERGIQPMISQRRKPGEPISADQVVGEVRRGRKRQQKTRDPLGRQRWPIERTNAWLKAKRRIATRRDRKATTYEAFLQLGMIIILAGAF
jgi:transposase